MIKNAHTAEVIHHAISEKLTAGSSYIECLVEYAKKHDLEIETVAEIVKKNTTIKELVRSEASKLRLVKEDPSVARICD